MKKIIAITITIVLAIPQEALCLRPIAQRHKLSSAGQITFDANEIEALPEEATKIIAAVAKWKHEHGHTWASYKTIRKAVGLDEDTMNDYVTRYPVVRRSLDSLSVTQRALDYIEYMLKNNIAVTRANVRREVANNSQVWIPYREDSAIWNAFSNAVAAQLSGAIDRLGEGDEDLTLESLARASDYSKSMLASYSTEMPIIRDLFIRHGLRQRQARTNVTANNPKASSAGQLAPATRGIETLPDEAKSIIAAVAQWKHKHGYKWASYEVIGKIAGLDKKILRKCVREYPAVKSALDSLSIETRILDVIEYMLRDKIPITRSRIMKEVGSYNRRWSRYEKDSTIRHAFANAVASQISAAIERIKAKYQYVTFENLEEETDFSQLLLARYEAQIPIVESLLSRYIPKKRQRRLTATHSRNDREPKATKILTRDAQGLGLLAYLYRYDFRDNAYTVLGVDQDAPEEDIRIAYHGRALAYHSDGKPDSNDEQMRKLNEARWILSDPERRAAYDRLIGKRLEIEYIRKCIEILDNLDPESGEVALSQDGFIRLIMLPREQVAERLDCPELLLDLVLARINEIVEKRGFNPFVIINTDRMIEENSVGAASAPKASSAGGGTFDPKDTEGLPDEAIRIINAVQRWKEENGFKWASHEVIRRRIRFNRSAMHRSVTEYTVVKDALDSLSVVARSLEVIAHLLSENIPVTGNKVMDEVGIDPKAWSRYRKDSAVAPAFEKAVEVQVRAGKERLEREGEPVTFENLAVVTGFSVIILASFNKNIPAVKEMLSGYALTKKQIQEAASRENKRPASNKVSLSTELGRALVLLGRPTLKTDAYSVLGVENDVSLTEIRDAYSRRAESYHPTKGTISDPELIRALSEAYKILSDPEKREIYDRLVRSRFEKSYIERCIRKLDRLDMGKGELSLNDDATERRVLLPREELSKRIGCPIFLLDSVFEEINKVVTRKGFNPFVITDNDSSIEEGSVNTEGSHKSSSAGGGTFDPKDIEGLPQEAVEIIDAVKRWREEEGFRSATPELIRQIIDLDEDTMDACVSQYSVVKDALDSLSVASRSLEVIEHFIKNRIPTTGERIMEAVGMGDPYGAWKRYGKDPTITAVFEKAVETQVRAAKERLEKASKAVTFVNLAAETGFSARMLSGFHKKIPAIQKMLSGYTLSQQQIQEAARRKGKKTPSIPPSLNAELKQFLALLGNPTLGRDIYDVLGVEKAASLRKIKDVYSRRSALYDPNKETISEEEFMEALREAYGILSDPKKRKIYDKFVRSRFEKKCIERYIRKLDGLDRQKGEVRLNDDGTERHILLPREKLSERIGCLLFMLDPLLEKINVLIAGRGLNPFVIAGNDHRIEKGPVNTGDDHKSSSAGFSQTLLSGESLVLYGPDGIKARNVNKHQLPANSKILVLEKSYGSHIPFAANTVALLSDSKSSSAGIVFNKRDRMLLRSEEVEGSLQELKKASSQWDADLEMSYLSRLSLTKAGLLTLCISLTKEENRVVQIAAIETLSQHDKDGEVKRLLDMLDEKDLDDWESSIMAIKSLFDFFDINSAAHLRTKRFTESLELGIRLGKQRIPPSATLMYGVPMAYKSAQGSFRKYKANLLTLETIAKRWKRWVRDKRIVWEDEEDGPLVAYRFFLERVGSHLMQLQDSDRTNALNGFLSRVKITDRTRKGFRSRVAGTIGLGRLGDESAHHELEFIEASAFLQAEKKRIASTKSSSAGDSVNPPLNGQLVQDLIGAPIWVNPIGKPTPDLRARPHTIKEDRLLLKHIDSAA